MAARSLVDQLVVGLGRSPLRVEERALDRSSTVSLDASLQTDAMISLSPVSL